MQSQESVLETRSCADEDTRAFLAKLTGSSKLARAAHAILAFQQPIDRARTASLQRHVVEQRLLRVERWLARAQ